MAEQYLPIKSWAEDDQPREKLLQKGVSALSTNELLAILLRSGQGGESALDLARRILMDCKNDLNLLARLEVRDLMNRYKGVGMAKAASIIAAIEIGRRRKQELVNVSPVIRSSRDVFHYMVPLIGDLDHEEFWIVYLSHSNQIKGSERLASGGMDSTVIDVRMIFRKALDVKAHFIIVAHNHPGGVPSPSSYDKTVTSKIKEAGKLIDIRLYDHIIVCTYDYFSFADHEIL